MDNVINRRRRVFGLLWNEIVWIRHAVFCKDWKWLQVGNDAICSRCTYWVEGAGKHVRDGDW